MKLAILTNYYYEFIPQYLIYTNVIKKLYCNKYKIDYIIDQSIEDKQFHAVWNKMPALLKILDKYDWVIWMDVDATPVNLNFDIKKYLQKQQKKIIMQKDKLGFNAGVFAVPNIDRSFEWLKYIYQKRFDETYRYNGYMEQDAMKDSFNDIYKDFWKQPDKSIGFNNYSDDYDDDIPNKFIQNKSWCLHLPALNSTIRMTIFKQKLYQYYKYI